MFDVSAQAYLYGCGRFSSVCGAIRFTQTDCAVMVQVHVRGLPCRMSGLLFPRLETCGRSVELAPLKVCAGQAAMTYLDGGLSAWELTGARITLCDGNGCPIAEGHVEALCPAPPSCPPRPLWPDWGRPPQPPCRPTPPPGSRPRR